jgi:hypothetical protein
MLHLAANPSMLAIYWAEIEGSLRVFTARESKSLQCVCMYENVSQNSRLLLLSCLLIATLYRVYDTNMNSDATSCRKKLSACRLS